VLLGIFLYLRQGARHPGLEPSPYYPGKEWQPQPEVDSGDEYYSVDDIVDVSNKTAGRQGSTTS
jgi:hypothetical protein